MNFSFGTKVALLAIGSPPELDCFVVKAGMTRGEYFMSKLKILLLVLVLSLLNGGCSPTGFLDSIMDRESRGDTTLAQNPVVQDPSQQIQNFHIKYKQQLFEE